MPVDIIQINVLPANAAAHQVVDRAGILNAHLTATVPRSK